MAVYSHKCGTRLFRLFQSEYYCPKCDEAFQGDMIGARLTNGK